MHFSTPPVLAGLIALVVIGIGCSYILAPQSAVTSFGLKLPALDTNTRAWLRLKGVRDVSLGMLVLILMATSAGRVVGIALLVAAIVPFGDMSVILGSGGSKAKAFSIHGFTCAVLLAVGFVMLHVS